MDIHSKKFDSATHFKLNILREYLKEWFPVFLRKKKKFWKDIFVYDFFTGEGYDTDGNIGSPLIILNELISYQEDINNESLRLNVIFNDIDKTKIQKLQSNIKLEDYNFNVEFINEDFTELFNRIYPQMKAYGSINLPRFMFLDQYGVKYVTRDIFLKIANLKRTDFLFFISSHHIQRFADSEEFQKYINVNKKDFEGSKPYQCHRVIFDYFKSMIPKNMELYLAPFSLQKQENSKNVYGLIFGTHHLLGIEKFMNVAWGLDGVSGEANFNIDGAIIEGLTYDLFNPDPRAKKLQYFEQELVEKINNGKITTLKEAYIFTFNYGCKPNHANKILAELQKRGKIGNSIKLISSNIHKLDDNISLSS